MKKFLLILLSIISVVCIACAGCETEPPKQTPLSEADINILRYYREPTLDMNFEDNVICVILKSGYDYLEEISFKDLKIVEKISRISYIRCNLIEYRYEDKKILFKKGDSNHMFKIFLEEHSKEKVLEVIDLLKTLDMVLVAEPDYIRYTTGNWVPSDIKYSNQWGLNGQNGINAERAWDITRGNLDVKVGIMEDNVELTHKDLQGRIQYGNITPSSKVSSMHGTAVAGIIGAIQDNDTGIAGIAGVAECSMYLLNRTDFSGSLEFAERIGIKIINASFEFIIDETKSGPNNYEQYSSQDYRALEEYSGLLIASAGNDGYNNDDISGIHHYPSDYDLPNVISVGNHCSTGEVCLDSNFGKNSVDLFAPGTRIYTTLYPDTYGYKDGTSFAAPFVTGVAALIYSICPDFTASEVKTAILNSVDKIADLTGNCVTGGKLNAYAAVSYARENHIQKYKYYNKDQHMAICINGLILGYEAHSFSLIKTTNSAKAISFSQICKSCGYIKHSGGIDQIPLNKKDENNKNNSVV